MVFLLTPDDFLAQTENPQSKGIVICQSRENNSLNMISFYIELRSLDFKLCGGRLCNTKSLFLINKNR